MKKKKFKAIAKRTINSFVSIVKIEEIMFEEDSDGYCQMPGNSVFCNIEIEGENSYNRAKQLASTINGA